MSSRISGKLYLSLILPQLVHIPILYNNSLRMNKANIMRPSKRRHLNHHSSHLQGTDQPSFCLQILKSTALNSQTCHTIHSVHLAVTKSPFLNATKYLKFSCKVFFSCWTHQIKNLTLHNTRHT